MIAGVARRRIEKLHSRSFGVRCAAGMGVGPAESSRFRATAIRTASTVAAMFFAGPPIPCAYGR